WDCTLEPVVSEQGSEVHKKCPTSLTADHCSRTTALRLGFRLIGGLNRKHADAIVAARADGPFGSFPEFVRRTGWRAGALKRLSQADVFGSLRMDRGATLWRALPERGPPTVFDRVDCEEPPVRLPPLAPLEEVLADYRAAGLSLRPHPISFLRPMLDSLRIVP